jgi:outer membrane protein
MKHRASIIAMLAALSWAGPSIAQPVAQPDAFARLGIARIKLADEGKIFLNGTRDPAAGYTTPEKWVANIELGYFVFDTVAVQFAGTTPATTPNKPAGSLEAVPNLGNDEFSIFTLTGTYHPLRGGPVSPYVGAGVALQHVWSLEDEFASNLQVDDAWGPVVQVGAEVAVSDRFGIYVDAKKAFYEADASADIGPNRITAVAELDPLILQAGVLVRF